MTNYVIVGLSFGDEGKGVVTEYLCSQDPGNTQVVRFSGGHQCGHKVVKGSVEHVFSNFGSGTLSGCPTYWSEYCTFEPEGFWKEYSLLRSKGITPRITVHPECPVTTIYDVFVSRNAADEAAHGTTGTGFFRTLKRHRDGVKLTVMDCLLPPSDLTSVLIKEKLRDIRMYFGGIRDDLDVSLFLEACSNIRGLVDDRVLCIFNRPIRRPHMVFEGSQGLLLDEHIGYFPHVTPSDVTPRNVLGMVDRIDEVYLVTRAYQTRHGNGPMTNTDRPLSLINTEKETNAYNKYQGEFRVSVLDLDQLIYAKTEGIDRVVNSYTRINLVITCTDQLSSYEVTSKGKVIAFNNADEFVRFIGSALKINGGLYVNTSPYSTTVREVRYYHD